MRKQCTVDTNNCELRWPLRGVTWKGGEDRKTIAHSDREHNPFLVLYDVQQVQSAEVSQRWTAVSSKCFQLYYTWSDRLFTVVLAPCSFHPLSPLLRRFRSSQLFCVHYRFTGFWCFSSVAPGHDRDSNLSKATTKPLIK
jgi:hypothetical protein